MEPSKNNLNVVPENCNQEVELLNFYFYSTGYTLAWYMVYKDIKLSQSLPIPAQRWLSLLLCATTAAALTVFLSNVSLVQQAYASWGSILNTSPLLHYSFAFLAGIGIKLMLDKFYISHAKRSIGFNWRYPPVTISVLLSLLCIVGYVYFTYSNEIVEQLIAHAFVSFKFLSLSFLAIAATIIYQTKPYTKNPMFSVVLCAVSAFYLFSAINLVEIAHAFCVFFCIAAAYLGMSIYLLSEQLRASKKELIAKSKQEAELTLESLEDFRKWFKDDSTIKNTEQLEPDLQVYAKRITERLRNGGDKYEEDIAQHMALCGPYGCGKSSIVAAIANELKRPKKIEVELPDEEKLKVEQQNSINWIHSDISTWGAASGSVAHVILSHIIDDISQRIDMCAFRALPKHYTEALKSGGSFFQFASTLLAGPVDIEQSFQKLNDVLEVTNHKLLITLQDVDRGTGDENEKRLNDIAALLDRLKDRKLSNINFIVAMGNENEVAAEVISKATDYRENILSSDTKTILVNFIISSLDAAVNSHQPKKNKHFYILEDSKFIDSTVIVSWRLQELSKLPFYNSVALVDKKIASLRELKKILRRVSQIWQPTGLMGEVSFISLLMSITLKEISPQKFNKLFQNKSYPQSYQDFDLTEFIEKISEYNDSNQDGFMFEYYRAMLGLEYYTTPEKKAVTEELKLTGKITDKKNLEKIEKRYRKIIFSGSNNFLQYAARKYENVCYLDRIVLETLPIDICSDQEIIQDIRSLFEIKKSDFNKLLPMVTKILSYNTTQKCSFERFMSVRGVFGIVDFNEHQESIGFDLTAHNRGNKSEYLVEGDIHETLIKIIVSNITVEWLYPLFEQFSSEKELMYNLMSLMGLETQLSSVLRRGIKKGGCVEAAFTYGLFKSYLQQNSDLGGFQLDGLKLPSLLGGSSIINVMYFVNSFYEADFRSISNAPKLNESIKKSLHKENTINQLVRNFLH